MIIPASKANRNLILFAASALMFGLSSSTAAGQTFDSVPQLAFTKQFAQADPLPQVLTIASTGANFNFTATATTSSGGSWLSVSPGGSNCCTTPEAITVTVSTTASLAAGTYTGEIDVSSFPGGSVSMAIPVTLTVVSSGPFFDNLPGQLSFSLKTGGAAPPFQLVQVRNKGTGSLNWTVTGSTADGGGWLSVAPGTGTAPSNLTVSIVPGNLPGGGLTGGTFVGDLVFTATGSSVTIPIVVSVGDSVFTQANPLSFTMPLAGANPLPQILTVASTGSDFNFSVSAATANGGAWLSVSPSGANCCTTPEAITVNITAPAGLPAGTYTGEIVLTSFPTRNLVMTVPVTLTVSPTTVPFLDNLPGHLSFSLIPGAPAPSSQIFSIRNKGTGTLGWASITGTGDGGSWLHISAAQGNAPSSVAISVTPANLPNGGLVAGTFVGQILIATATGNVSVPVVVFVGNQVFSQVNPLSFTMPLAGANPLPQIMTIASAGSNFNFTVSSATANGGAWLSVSPAGSNCCATPEALTVSITAPAGLVAGTYTGEIVLTSFPTRNLVMTVPVTLTVEAPTVSYLDNLPGQISFSMSTGGAAPPYQLLQIRKVGTAALGWQISASTADRGNWLGVSATQGNAPSIVVVAIVPANLPNAGLVAGTFTGQIQILTATGTATIPVSVVVGSSVFSQVNPLNFTMPLGGKNPLPQTITVGSTDSNLNFTVSASTATGGAWLSVSPTGSNCCSTPEAISVSITAPAGLAAGAYTGEIVITEFPSRTFSMTVPVTLTVAPPTTAFFDNLPGQISFSMKTGGSAPPYQLLQIRNGGAGTLGWKLLLSTADGGNWLSASAGQGNAPSTVAIAIAPANLPSAGLVSGTFIGQIDILTAVGSTTIPVSVLVGDSVFSQVNPLSFAMPFGGANPLPQILTVASTGSASNFTVSAATATGGAWLSVSPAGSNCCSTPEALTVNITAPAGLAAGTYTGEILITEFPSRTFSMTVPVTLTVAPTASAFLDNLPGQLSFSMKTGGLPPPYQVVQIRNGGTGSLPWALSKDTSDGGNWLTVSANQGAAPSTLAVAINPANLPGAGLVAGTYVGQVLIATAGGNVTIPVNMVIGDPVFRQVNPLSFTMPAGGANPLPQLLTVASTGSILNFTVSASTATGGAWLSVSPAGSNCCSTPEALTVSITAPAGLAAGTYTGEILITEFPSRTLPMTVAVTLTVAPSTMAFFDNLPSQLSFFMSTGGSAPAGQGVSIRNAGAGALPWGSVKSTADSGAWLSMAPTQGTAPSSVGVSINPANLPGGGLVAGTYVGQILFASGGGNATIPVSIAVGDPGFIASPAALSFSMPVGGSNPLPQSLTITSSGASINFSATAYSATGGNWLKVSPQGSNCCSTGQTLTVSVTAPAGLAAGTYTGEITIIQFASRNEALTVPVYLTVQ